MIVVDTSALMAIVLGEAEAAACMKVLEVETEVLISAGTLAEALIVASRRNVAGEILRLVEGLGFEIVTMTSASARRIAEAYARWGKGMDLAGLNFGDCFAYELARENSCPLLFVGSDFARTDVIHAV
jgi:ribonuclease VapC